MDAEKADGKRGKCTKEYLPHPPHTWPIWVVDGRYAIFSCLDGYSYESQNQYILLCDQDTEQWKLFQAECVELTQPAVEVGSRTSTMTKTSRTSSEINKPTEQPSQLTSFSREEALLSTKMGSNESSIPLNTLPFTANWSSTIPTAFREELSPVTEHDNQITHRTEQETESSTSDVQPTGSLGTIFTDSNASAVSNRELYPDTVTLVTLAKAEEQSTELRVSSDSEDDAGSTTFLNSQTISDISNMDITKYDTKYDFAPLPLILGVLFVIVTLVVIIVLVVVLRRKKYRSQKAEQLHKSDCSRIYHNDSATCIDLPTTANQHNYGENKMTGQASNGNSDAAPTETAEELSISNSSNEINNSFSRATLSSSLLDVNGYENTEDETSNISMNDDIYPGCVPLRISGLQPYSDTSTRL